MVTGTGLCEFVEQRVERDDALAGSFGRAQFCVDGDEVVAAAGLKTMA